MSPNGVAELRKLSCHAHYLSSKEDVWRLLDTVAARDEEIVELMRLADDANDVVNDLERRLDEATHG
jgi:hypothetical protein